MELRTIYMRIVCHTNNAFYVRSALQTIYSKIACHQIHNCLRKNGFMNNLHENCLPCECIFARNFLQMIHTIFAWVS